MKARSDRAFYVYILAGESGVLYTGVTNALRRRISEHKNRQVPGFTQQYNVTRLVWFEIHSGPKTAIAREKQVKSWRRSKKIDLINAANPEWRDLTLDID